MNPRMLIWSLAVLILLGLIVWSGSELLRLQKGEALVASVVKHSDNAREALEAAKSIEPKALSARQLDRVDQAVLVALKSAALREPILERIGGQSYDAARPGPWRFASERVTFGFKIGSGGLAKFIDRVRCGEVTAEFTGSPKEAHIPVTLDDPDKIQRADILLFATLPSGAPVEIPGPRGIELLRDTKGPEFTIIAAATTLKSYTQSTIEPERFQVIAGAQLKIIARDAVGIEMLKWCIDRTPHKVAIEPGAASRETQIELPDTVLQTPGRKVFEFSVEATNQLGNLTKVTLLFDARSPKWHPVQETLVNGEALSTQSLRMVPGTSVKVRLLVNEEDRDEGALLTVQGSGRSVATVAVENGFEAEVEIARETPTGLQIQRGSQVLYVLRVQADASAPVARLLRADGQELKPGSHRFNPEDRITLEITDSGGIDPSLLFINAGTLTPVGEPARGSHHEDHMFLVSPGTRTTLSVRAADKVGNQSETFQWELEAPVLFEVLSAEVVGQSAGTSRPISSSTIQLRLVTTGPGSISVLIADPEATEASRAESLVCTDAGASEHVLETGVPDGAERRIGIAVTRAGKTAVLEAELAIDRKAPVLKLMVGANEHLPGTVLKTPLDGSLVLEVRERFGVPEIKLKGVVETGRSEIDGTLRMELKLPEVVSSSLEIEATDLAGNVSRREWSVLAPPVVGKEAENSTPLSTPKPPVRDLPATLTNSADGAKLFLIKSEEDPSMPPFYAYETEVTVSMFGSFLQAVGKNASWWESVPDPFSESKILSKPEEHRNFARNLVDEHSESNAPVANVTREVALAYLLWAQSGVRDGTLAIPTLDEWKTAAGRGLNLRAEFPITGAFPDGQDLKDRSAPGKSGGAAIGYPDRAPHPNVKSFAPGAYGLYDMAGSVFEWVRDKDGRWYGIGGGHWSKKEACRLVAHQRKVEGQIADDLGLRLILRPLP